jgi:PIN domain nuclease of toxin-antitoxin system
LSESAYLKGDHSWQSCEKIVGERLTMSKYVLDASAALALLNQEPGMDQVEPILNEAAISAVNASEVLTKLVDAGMPIDEAKEVFDLLNIVVIDFDKELSEKAASLRDATRKKGLSLGDRCCLALGLHLGLEVVTAEREWAKLKLGQIIVIR